MIISRKMNAPFHPDSLSLAELKVGSRAAVKSVDWTALEPAEACRLRHFGFDEGVLVEALHLGPFGRDPLAIRVGRMTVAIRRNHARAIQIVPA
jgi:ferrous iron transport protein A